MTVEIPTVTEIVIIEPDGTVVEIAGNRGPQGVKGDTGDQGDPGPTGVVAATTPATYDSETQTVGVTVGTTANTVAAGDDSRITGAAQKASNLTDLTDPAAARAALGLGSAAQSATSAFEAAGAALAAQSAAQSYAAGLVDDLSGVADAATARANLGLGTMATATASDYLSKAGNLDGIADAAAARTNLGLGTMATQAASAYAALTGATFTGALRGPNGSAGSPGLAVFTAGSYDSGIQGDGSGFYMVAQGQQALRAHSSLGLMAYMKMRPPGDNPAAVVLRTQGAAAQTANLQTWENSSNSVRARVSNSGLGVFTGLISNANSIINGDGNGSAALRVTASAAHGIDDAAFSVVDSGLNNLLRVSRRGASIGGVANTSYGLLVTPPGAGNVVAVARGAASQTANLQEWQTNLGVALASINTNGSFTGGGFTAGGYAGGNLRGSIMTVGADVIGLAIKGASAQTANLSEWRNSSDTVLAYVNAAGQAAFNHSVLVNGGSEVYAKSLTSGYWFAGSPKLVFATTGSTVSANLDNQVPLTVNNAHATPSANLQNWQANTVTVASISASGKGLFTNVGPTSGNLNLIDSANDIGVQIRTSDVTIPKRIISSAAGASALTMSGQIVAAASTSAASALRVPHGTAPTSPVDGDMWTTSSGAFIRINGVTKQFTLT